MKLNWATPHCRRCASVWSGPVRTRAREIFYSICKKDSADKFELFSLPRVYVCSSYFYTLGGLKSSPAKERETADREWERESVVAEHTSLARLLQNSLPPVNCQGVGIKSCKKYPLVCMRCVYNEKAATTRISFNINGTVRAGRRWKANGVCLLWSSSGSRGEKGLHQQPASQPALCVLSLARRPCGIDWRVHNIVGTMTSHTQSYILRVGGWLAAALEQNQGGLRLIIMAMARAGHSYTT